MATSQASTSVSFKTILFATDFSSSSEAALPYVLSLAHFFDSTVLAVHAVPYDPISGLATVPPAVELDAEWRDAHAALRNYEETHPFTGLRHEFILERGLLKDVMADLVARHAVDLVVIGTHGRQGFRKIFAGSFAEEIFRTAKCPILTVGPGAVVPPEKWMPRRILFATEFAEGSMHALPLALALADTTGAELQVMHAVPLVPWEQQCEMTKVYEERLQKLIPADSPHRCRIDFAVTFDLAGPGILNTAQVTKADLIVMGVHQARFPALDAHVPGTTASEVICNAHCPVLTVCG